MAGDSVFKILRRRLLCAVGKHEAQEFLDTLMQTLVLFQQHRARIVDLLRD
jgi:hypothetical protein